MNILVNKVVEHHPHVDRMAMERLLSFMEPCTFLKGECLVRRGERNASFYVVNRGVFRAFRLNDGVEHTLWFAWEGVVFFPIWCYLNNSPSEVEIIAECDCEAYVISKREIDELCSTSLTISNLIRNIFEQHAMEFENYMLFYTDNSGAKERYLSLLREAPELLQIVSLKKIASYLFITPQSLSRIRASLKIKE